MTKFDEWAKNYRQWLKGARNDLKLSLIITSVVILVLAIIILGFKRNHSAEPVKLGVSFSIKYAKELDNNWKQNFLALTDELEVKNMRLMSYWDLLEPENNKWDFTDLDWQMDQAQSKNVKVTMAIGQRQPRWPECHVPAWLHNKTPEEKRMELLEYIVAVVMRYKDNPALESYQLENEAANNLFGECPEFDPQLLQDEFDLIKKLDTDNDVIINTSNQSGIPLFNGVGDRTGFSMYNHAYFPLFGRQQKWDYGYVPAEWHSLRAGLIEGIHGNTTFVHELQTEPWGPKPTNQLPADEQLKLMDGEKIVDTVNYALDTGMKEVYLWGGEWWYYRKENFGDKQLWNTVKNLYHYYSTE